MGAWGHTAFENDQALDWFGNELEHSADAATLLFAIDVAASADADSYLDSDEACCALAAAEIVAAMIGHPMANLNPLIAEWVASHPIEIGDGLIASAKQAVERVATNSELCDLWEESDSGGPWSNSNADLVRRLSR
jgi:hypothetical protein